MLGFVRVVGERVWVGHGVLRQAQDERVAGGRPGLNSSIAVAINQLF